MVTTLQGRVVNAELKHSREEAFKAALFSSVP